MKKKHWLPPNCQKISQKFDQSDAKWKKGQKSLLFNFYGP